MLAADEGPSAYRFSRDRFLRLDASMTAAALAVYAVLLAVALPVVLRRPAVALTVFVVGLPLHNIVMSLLYGGGVRGGALDAIQAWKEIVLAAALAVGRRPGVVSERRLPFRSGLVDGLALAFAAVVVLYALIPQSALGGHAGAKAVAVRPAPRPRPRRRVLPRTLGPARHPRSCAGRSQARQRLSPRGG